MTVMSRMTLYLPILRCSHRISKFIPLKQHAKGFKTKRTTKGRNIEAPEVEPVEPHGVNVGRSPASSDGILGKYFLYTAVAVPAFFTGCAIWQYETTRKIIKSRFDSRGQKSVINDPKQYGFRDHMNAIWNQIPPSLKIVVEIIAANAVVFLLWKVPSLTPVMSRYFSCMPTKAHSVLASTLSSFSHTSALHLFVNMYVLMSLTAPLGRSLGKEQFLAVYLAGGTISGLTSSIYRVMSGRMIPSIGASGSILAMIAIVCMQFPDARFSIAFVDHLIPHSFSAQTALAAIIMLDCVGLMRGWRFLDHAGHLGGVLFGVFYSLYGAKIVNNYKQVLLKKYNRIREGRK